MLEKMHCLRKYYIAWGKNDAMFDKSLYKNCGTYVHVVCMYVWYSVRNLCTSTGDLWDELEKYEVH